MVFLYCKYTKDYSVVDYFASILKQLLHQAGRLTPESMHFLRSCKNQKRPLTLVEIQRVISSEIQTLSRILIGIDAIEECLTKGVRSDLLRELTRLAEHASVRLFITSTPGIAQENVVKSNRMIRREIKASKNDLSLRVRSYIATNLALKTVLGQDENLISDIVTHISERAGGV